MQLLLTKGRLSGVSVRPPTLILAGRSWEPEHRDDLARWLVWWSSMSWTVDCPHAQGARLVRAAVVGGDLGKPTPHNVRTERPAGCQ